MHICVEVSRQLVGLHQYFTCEDLAEEEAADQELRVSVVLDLPLPILIEHDELSLKWEQKVIGNGRFL